MTTRCTVCAHKDRKAIDEALIMGRSLRDVARQHGPSKDALTRHRDHISPALARIVEKRRTEGGPRSALDRLEDLYERASRVLDAAEQGGQGAQALSAIAQLRGIVDTLARVTGELDERPTVNVLNLQTSSEWLSLRATVLDALGPHPAARDAVVQALAGQDPAPVVRGEVQ